MPIEKATTSNSYDQILKQTQEDIENKKKSIEKKLELQRRTAETLAKRSSRLKKASTPFRMGKTIKSRKAREALAGVTEGELEQAQKQYGAFVEKKKDTLSKKAQEEFEEALAAKPQLLTDKKKQGDVVGQPVSIKESETSKTYSDVDEYSKALNEWVKSYGTKLGRGEERYKQTQSILEQEQQKIESVSDRLFKKAKKKKPTLDPGESTADYTKELNKWIETYGTDLGRGEERYKQTQSILEQEKQRLKQRQTEQALKPISDVKYNELFSKAKELSPELVKGQQPKTAYKIRYRSAGSWSTVGTFTPEEIKKRWGRSLSELQRAKSYGVRKTTKGGTEDKYMAGLGGATAFYTSEGQLKSIKAKEKQAKGKTYNPFEIKVSDGDIDKVIKYDVGKKKTNIYSSRDPLTQYKVFEDVVLDVDKGKVKSLTDYDVGRKKSDMYRGGSYGQINYNEFLKSQTLFSGGQATKKKEFENVLKKESGDINIIGKESKRIIDDKTFEPYLKKETDYTTGESILFSKPQAQVNITKSKYKKSKRPEEIPQASELDFSQAVPTLKTTKDGDIVYKAVRDVVDTGEKRKQILSQEKKSDKIKTLKEIRKTETKQKELEMKEKFARGTLKSQARMAMATGYSQADLTGLTASLLEAGYAPDIVAGSALGQKGVLGLETLYKTSKKIKKPKKESTKVDETEDITKTDAPKELKPFLEKEAARSELASTFFAKQVKQDVDKKYGDNFERDLQKLYDKYGNFIPESEKNKLQERYNKKIQQGVKEKIKKSDLDKEFEERYKKEFKRIAEKKKKKIDRLSLQEDKLLRSDLSIMEKSQKQQNLAKQRKEFVKDYMEFTSPDLKKDLKEKGLDNTGFFAGVKDKGYIMGYKALSLIPGLEKTKEVEEKSKLLQQKSYFESLKKPGITSMDAIYGGEFKKSEMTTKGMVGKGLLLGLGAPGIAVLGINKLRKTIDKEYYKRLSGKGKASYLAGTAIIGGTKAIGSTLFKGLKTSYGGYSWAAEGIASKIPKIPKKKDDSQFKLKSKISEFKLSGTDYNKLTSTYKGKYGGLIKQKKKTGELFSGGKKALGYGEEFFQGAEDYFKYSPSKATKSVIIGAGITGGVLLGGGIVAGLGAAGGKAAVVGAGLSITGKTAGVGLGALYAGTTYLEGTKYSGAERARFYGGKAGELTAFSAGGAIAGAGNVLGLRTTKAPYIRAQAKKGTKAGYKEFKNLLKSDFKVQGKKTSMGQIRSFKTEGLIKPQKGNILEQFLAYRRNIRSISSTRAKVITSRPGKDVLPKIAETTKLDVVINPKSYKIGSKGVKSIKERGFGTSGKDQYFMGEKVKPGSVKFFSERGGKTAYKFRKQYTSGKPTEYYNIKKPQDYSMIDLTTTKGKKFRILEKDGLSFIKQKRGKIYKTKSVSPSKDVSFGELKEIGKPKIMKDPKYIEYSTYGGGKQNILFDPKGKYDTLVLGLRKNIKTSYPKGDLITKRISAGFKKTPRVKQDILTQRLFSQKGKVQGVRSELSLTSKQATQIQTKFAKGIKTQEGIGYNLNKDLYNMKITIPKKGMKGFKPDYLKKAKKGSFIEQKFKSPQFAKKQDPNVFRQELIDKIITPKERVSTIVKTKSFSPTSKAVDRGVKLDYTRTLSLRSRVPTKAPKEMPTKLSKIGFFDKTYTIRIPFSNRFTKTKKPIKSKKQLVSQNEIMGGLKRQELFVKEGKRMLQRMSKSKAPQQEIQILSSGKQITVPAPQQEIQILSSGKQTTVPVKGQPNTFGRLVTQPSPTNQPITVPKTFFRTADVMKLTTRTRISPKSAFSLGAIGIGSGTYGALKIAPPMPEQKFKSQFEIRKLYKASEKDLMGEYNKTFLPEKLVEKNYQKYLSSLTGKKSQFSDLNQTMIKTKQQPKLSQKTRTQQKIKQIQQQQQILDLGLTSTNLGLLIPGITITPPSFRYKYTPDRITPLGAFGRGSSGKGRGRMRFKSKSYKEFGVLDLFGGSSGKSKDTNSGLKELML